MKKQWSLFGAQLRVEPQGEGQMTLRRVQNVFMQKRKNSIFD